MRGAALLALSVAVLSPNAPAWDNDAVSATAAKAKESTSKIAAAKRISDQRKVGKAWVVEFANGQKDTWTMFHKADDGGLPMHFRSSSGQEMQISNSNGIINVVMKQGCIMNGHLIEGKVQGLVLYGCTQPRGIRFVATVQR